LAALLNYCLFDNTAAEREVTSYGL
jgi:hypothetical protein